jgi:hypothetical protein
MRYGPPIALASVAAVAAASYSAWQDWSSERRLLTPLELSQSLGLASTPSSLTVVACRSRFPGCGNGYTLDICVGTIAPSQFKALLSGGSYQHQPHQGSSHELTGVDVGDDFPVAHRYWLGADLGNLTERGYVSLPSGRFSGYGYLRLYADESRQRFALESRLLVSVDC